MPSAEARCNTFALPQRLSRPSDAFASASDVATLSAALPASRIAAVAEALAAIATRTVAPGAAKERGASGLARRVDSRIGTPPGWPAMRSSRPRSRICEIGQWKGSSRSDASKTQLGMMVTASERSHKHGNRGTTRVRPRTEASARASRSASKCRRTNSRCARSRGDRRSAVGTSQPVRYLSSKSLLADGSLSGGRGPARGCGGAKVRKPPAGE
mmetsp:Transcript_11238/g.37195  ORF Transcript_11238/g.37195 Transcript_11238/m.37195 type:complete len:214 (+) Transcript_11238:413-1054(+)